MIARATSRVAPWHKWPFLVAIPTLAGIRVNMRWLNLFDTETAPPRLTSPEENPRSHRTADGSFNGLDIPWMGMAGARFGRNVPINETFGDEPPRLLEPNPRRISNDLLARQVFVPVPYLNVLVSAWLQFMVHDWLSHGENDQVNPAHEVPISGDDDWPQKPMTVLRTTAAPTTSADDGRPTPYRNIATHWWDGSQIYGSTLQRQLLIRSNPANGELLPDGKIGLQPNGHLPIEKMRDEIGDAAGAKFPDLELTGVNGNWWLGLSVMHTLFAREHNAVVDRLKLDFPQAGGEWLFQKARLAVTALIAKIHTTEWTPSLMNSPEGRFAMRGNWWGVLGEHYRRGYGRLGDSEEMSGIPGSSTAQDAAPYAMTEEFTACYRMHPLMPDAFSLRSHVDDREIMKKSLLDVARSGPARLYREMDFDDVVYSLATSNPGALALHNYPNTLRRLPEKPEQGVYTDLAATDILRDRERGVPRYCQFRRLIGMPAPKSFDELTTNPHWREEVRAVYKDVEDVDLLVGTLCESQADPGTPSGFGFSDTVFRIFILMASRRLRSDRFYTSDFTPDVYTPAGFAWVADNNLRTVLQRHCPLLAPLFADCRNVFFPWSRGAT
jgi:Animal haem peroxidase